MANKLYQMTPREIVAELDKYIIGQDEAKKSVAVALRNRYRRSLLSEEMQEEITPKNILMMGPTGVGKTEIARRLAKLMDAPFVKVEATKFTEVGYVGRDVDSMIRDLVEASIRITKQNQMEEKYAMAEKLAEDRIVEALCPGGKKEAKSSGTKNPFDAFLNSAGYQTQKQQYEQQQLESQQKPADDQSMELTREQIRQQLRAGLLEEQMVEIQVTEAPKGNTLDLNGGDGMIAIGNIFGDMMPQKKKNKKVRVKEARKILREEEAQNMLDMDQVTEDALRNAEQNGIIFIDEIDKIASGGYRQGADVSREGVQRDILPIVEGSVVNTKHGPVKTDHILFIGAGAFHVSKPTDLIPELQGRFPIRVELENLDRDTFLKILTVPENALLKQHKALLETEGVDIEFTDSAIEEIATMAFMMNEQTENIGARRLHTILEKLLEDISFNIPDMDVEKFVIDDKYVKEKFEEKIHSEDLDQYIL